MKRCEVGNRIHRLCCSFSICISSLLSTLPAVLGGWTAAANSLCFWLQIGSVQWRAMAGDQRRKRSEVGLYFPGFFPAELLWAGCNPEPKITALVGQPSPPSPLSPGSGCALASFRILCYLWQFPYSLSTHSSCTNLRVLFISARVLTDTSMQNSKDRFRLEMYFVNHLFVDVAEADVEIKLLCGGTAWRVFRIELQESLPCLPLKQGSEKKPHWTEPLGPPWVI